MNLHEQARLHNDPFPGTNMTEIPTETMRMRLTAVATKARTKISAFNARHGIVDPETVRKDVAAAREKMAKAREYLRAVYQAEEED